MQACVHAYCKLVQKMSTAGMINSRALAVVCISLFVCLMPFNKLFIILVYSVCTQKYLTSVFLQKARPTGLAGLYKKISARHFSVRTSRSFDNFINPPPPPVSSLFNFFNILTTHTKLSFLRTIEISSKN